MRKYLLLLAIGISIPLIFSSCKKDDDDDDDKPTTGIVQGTVTSSSGDSLIDVSILLFNANTNEFTGQSIKTNGDGYYSFTIAGGSYYITVSQQGYQDIPAKGVPPLPFTITNGSTTTNNVVMDPATSSTTGWVSGKLTTGNNASLSGCLIVLSDGTNAYSTLTNSSGEYVIYNVEASGAYNANAWKKGISGTQVSISVTQGAETIANDIAISSITGVTVSGAVTFLATQNADIDVSLSHPETGDNIPGLSGFTSGGNYSFSGVANGTYLARPTFANDGLVLDPDWVVKNGEPLITVSGSSIQLDYSVTGAVDLISPTNPAENTIPVLVSSNPTFEWDSYSSTSDYVIEVTDAKGNLIWGGFSSNWTVKNIVIPSSQTTIQWNSDGMATGTLESGKVYRWRIYASKDNTQSPTGWELISQSEDQRGLIEIQ